MNRVTRALRIAKLARSLGNYDTNVMGMVGEVIAEEIFGMTKTSKQAKDIDGHIMIDGASRSVQGNPGQYRDLSDGVSELKIDVGPGYRVYYSQRGSRLLLLLAGGDKSTQQKDIAKAIDLAKNF